jgi:hypothetical protein
MSGRSPAPRLHNPCVDEPAVTVTVGSRSTGLLQIEVRGRSFPDPTDKRSADWLDTPITVVAGGLEADLPRAQLRRAELHDFRVELEAIYRDLSGRAQLRSIDRWIELDVVMATSGHIEVQGLVRDSPGSNSRDVLGFEITGLDQTFLPSIVASLKRADDVAG